MQPKKERCVTNKGGGPFAFLAQVLLRALPVVFAVSLVTVGVDPANLFRGTAYERGIATLLAEGRNVAAIGNHDDRLVQRYLTAKLDAAPEVVVLGSSRAMQIRRGVAGDAGFFNASVSEAALEDLEAVSQLYLELEPPPQVMILSVDPWDLQETDWLIGWKSLSTERDRMLESMGRDAGGHRMDRLEALLRYGQALSPSYFQASSRRLFRSLTGDDAARSVYFATGKAELDVPVKLADGSLVYDAAMRLRSSEETERAALEYAVEWRDRIDRVGRLEPARQAEFEDFVDQLMSRGVRVIIYLGPYHPTTYAYFLRERDLRLGGAVEDYLRSIAATRDIEVLGSYDPARAGVGPDDFFDALHVRETGVAKIFGARAVSGAPRPALTN
jgi:hypothetical protein